MPGMFPKVRFWSAFILVAAITSAIYFHLVTQTKLQPEMISETTGLTAEFGPISIANLVRPRNDQMNIQDGMEQVLVQVNHESEKVKRIFKCSYRNYSPLDRNGDVVGHNENGNPQHRSKFYCEEDKMQKPAQIPTKGYELNENEIVILTETKWKVLVLILCILSGELTLSVVIIICLFCRR